MFDPPFRWFRPRDLLETAIADEGYHTLTRFMRTVPGYLRDGGRVLIHFGTSADLPYLKELMDAGGFSQEVVLQSDLVGEWPVSYFVFQLTAAQMTS